MFNYYLQCNLNSTNNNNIIPLDEKNEEVHSLKITDE